MNGQSYNITHEDGTKETVYITPQNTNENKRQVFKDDITLVYFVVGTAVLLLTGYVAVKNLQNRK